MAKQATFLSSCRIARLASDFARDLHQRVFRAFASLGFDDNSWYSTDDLRSIVMMGQLELGKAQTAQQEVELKLQTGSSQAFPHDSEKPKLEKDLDTKKKALKKLADRLRPLQEELTKRDKSAAVPHPPDG